MISHTFFLHFSSLADESEKQNRNRTSKKNKESEQRSKSVPVSARTLRSARKD